jgi:release factor glutamine methyltransferase
MATVRDAVARARDALTAAGIAPDEAALDADLLARHILGWDRARLLSEALHEPPPFFATAYADVIGRRSRREPIAHITGHREFWGLDFEVTADVLTPRPETELIVEEAIACFPDRSALHLIADVGTGSGCLAVALAREFPSARVLATDISEAALVVARRNAVRHEVSARIAFLHASFMPPVREIDLVVSNPPYIPVRDAATLPPEVRDHEPAAALFGGEDGLEVYPRLFAEAASEAGPDAPLIVEVGYDQRDAVAVIADAAGWRVDRVRHDLQGIARVLVLKRHH